MKKIILAVFLLLSSCSYHATEVIDGDTIKTEIGTIRFSGINTPEKGECYYEEAKEKTKELVLHKQIKLEGDYVEEDEFGRKLRYIYVEQTFVNGLLVEEGYARVFDVYNKTTKRYNELKVLEEKAKSENKGIWNC
jgi:micrococcal nuclease